MFMNMLTDRKEAGLLLAEKLLKYKGSDALVLAIPRGGVPIAHEIAQTLGLPMDLVLSKKIGHPLNPEFAIGSVSSDTVLIDPHDDIPFEYIENEIERLKKDLKDKYKKYAGDLVPLDVKGRTIILVDDGIATGNTLLATVKMLRKKDPSSVVIVSPVVPHDRVQKIRQAADEFVFLFAPEYFTGVGAFYKNFTQVEDEEVKSLLEDNRKKNPDHDKNSNLEPEETFTDLFLM
jgi:putative phosphoribosyl transferase